MQIHVQDTLALYRNMLDCTSQSDIEHIFIDEMMRPYESMLNVFGVTMDTSDPNAWHILKAKDMWGLRLPNKKNQDHFAEQLTKLEQADALATIQNTLELTASQFAPYAVQLHASILCGLFLAHPEKLENDDGHSGIGSIPGYIMLTYGEVTENNLARLPALTAHEFHHNIRFKLFPFNPIQVTVGDYILAEGLAESFATAMCGEEQLGYMVNDFDTSEEARVKAIFKEALNKTGFDTVRAYIFGDDIAQEYGWEPIGIPRLAGYYIGYQVVQHYLHNTGVSIVEATLKPYDEILEQSGYFNS